MHSNRPIIKDSSDEQAKFIQERIYNVEKHVGDLCEALGVYTRQSARLRDRTDELARKLAQCAEAEHVNHTFKSGLKGFADCLSTVGDHRDAYIRRLEAHVIGAFTPLGPQCKDLRDEVKATFSARDRELGRRKQVEKLKQRNPRNRQKILLAETDLARASGDVSRSLRTLEERMDAFESNKLQTTTSALQNLVRAELALHVREVELLTQAYAQLDLIDEERDIEDFKMARGEIERAFRCAVRAPPATAPRSSDLRSSLRSSLANLFSPSSTLGADQRGSSRGASAPSTPTQPVQGQSPPSPVSRIVPLHGDEDDVEDTNSSDSSTSTMENRDRTPPPRFQRSISQPKLWSGNK